MLSLGGQLAGKQLDGIQIPSQSDGRIEEEQKKLSDPKFERVQIKSEEHMGSKPNQELLFLGLDRSISSIRESGVAQCDELLMRLIQKASTLLQEIKLSKK